MTTKSIGKGFTIDKDGKVKRVLTGSASDKIRKQRSKKVRPGRKP